MLKIKISYYKKVRNEDVNFELFLVGFFKYDTFQTSVFTSEGVCWAGCHGFIGRVGPGAAVEGCEGGLGFNPCL